MFGQEDGVYVAPPDQVAQEGLRHGLRLVGVVGIGGIEVTADPAAVFAAVGRFIDSVCEFGADERGDKDALGYEYV